MIGLIGHYYGVDLVGTIFSIIGVYMLGNKKPNPNGFIICAVGNALWIVVGLLTASVGLVIVNIVLAVLNGRGFIAWKKAHA